MQTFLKQILRGIKKMFSNIAIQVGIMGLPLSVVILFFAVDKMNGFGFWIMVIFSFIMMILSYRAVIWGIKQAKKELAEQRQKDNRDGTQLNTLIIEMRTMREDNKKFFSKLME